MKLPLIIEEHGDLLVFPDEVAACEYLEPVDIVNNEYVAYDSAGNIIELAVEDAVTISRIAGTTTVQTVVVRGKTDVNRAAELEQKIRDFLAVVGMVGATENLDLRELVKALDTYLNE